jgi:hypothetical protein
VDGRVKPGHDENRLSPPHFTPLVYHPALW